MKDDDYKDDDYFDQVFLRCRQDMWQRLKQEYGVELPPEERERIEEEILIELDFSEVKDLDGDPGSQKEFLEMLEERIISQFKTVKAATIWSDYKRNSSRARVSTKPESQTISKKAWDRRFRLIDFVLANNKQRPHPAWEQTVATWNEQYPLDKMSKPTLQREYRRARQADPLMVQVIVKTMDSWDETAIHMHPLFVHIGEAMRPMREAMEILSKTMDEAMKPMREGIEITRGLGGIGKISSGALSIFVSPDIKGGKQ